MGIRFLPDATLDLRGRKLTWAERTDPKGCLHTTETAVAPSYTGWTVHPHLTVVPVTRRRLQVLQHIPFDQASFALRNQPGGVETNRDLVYQVELVGTSERGGPGVYWPEAEDELLVELYDLVIRPMEDGLGVPVQALEFQRYPDSYGAKGNTNRVRLSGSEFDTYTGWLGHQHVPENTHGDPGDFPWDRMIEVAVKSAAVAEEDADMRLVRYDDKDPKTASPYYLVGDFGKIHVPNSKVLAELRDKMRIPDCGPVTLETLNLFPNHEQTLDSIRGSATGKQADAILAAVKALTPSSGTTGSTSRSSKSKES